MKVLRLAVLACALSALGAASAFAADAPDLDKSFHDTVMPFTAKYCAGCHSGAMPTAQFDIKSYDSLDKIKTDFPRWQLVGERLLAKAANVLAAVVEGPFM